jgi:glycosyltransferase involved in cell wall biosynthesis
MHDLSTETLRAKLGPAPGRLRHLLPALAALERWSLKLSDLMVSTNDSILERARLQHPDVKAVVVRNSNPVIHTTVEQVKKHHNDGRMRIGFFGLLADDPAAGLENIIAVAKRLRDAKCPFVMQIVGTGPGLLTLRTLVSSENLSENFEFLGFIPIPAAYAVISRFDFGLVAWGNLPKNHLHTAMKIMDYMCCAVPVCSLNLVEQLRSTAGVGIHADDFITLANQMIAIHHEPAEYDALRRATLAHFNEVLCWELQEKKLRGAYGDMLCMSDRGSVPC